MEKLKELIENNKMQKGSLIGLLQDISEEFGYLPEELMKEVSKEMEVPLSRLFSLATFYTTFRLEPRGKHHVCACVGTACHVKGAPKIVDSLERELSIKAGETSPDREFTFETVNCLGACALGPLLVVDGDYHGNMDQKKLKNLLKDLRGKAPDEEEQGIN
ncbi:MAG: NAD(P)H-dependent oxidoreductase subunit E [Spirochaetota bacterium]